MDALATMIGQTETLSGGAGWVGAGLLGLILSWLLLMHLPNLAKKDTEKDKQWMELVKNKDDHVDRLVVRFEASLQTIRDQCKRELDDLTSLFERALASRLKMYDALKEVEKRKGTIAEEKKP